MRARLAFALIAFLTRACSPSAKSLSVSADAPSSHCQDRELPCQTSENSGTQTGGNDPPRKLISKSVYERYFEGEVEVRLDEKRAELEDAAFVSYDSRGNAYPSKSYVYVDFVKGLRSMSGYGVGGGGDDHVYFYIGQTDGLGAVHGLVNVAAFLAHAMAVSIKYDACDEFNIDATDFTQKYAISNSCGQYGRSYQDEVCVGEEAYMTCNADLNMTIIAADSLDGEKSPPPLECRPKESATDFTGHWDAELGSLSERYPYANRVGVMHNEGCCWWGRGVLFTRGTCNFGRLNHFLGRQAAAQGFLNFFDVDLCIYPELVCSHHDTRGLRWSVGYFEWADRVQTYKSDTEGLDYLRDLDCFVTSGFVDVNRFIDLVGNALPFGCVEANCFAAEEKLKLERRDNFLNLVFNVLDLPNLVDVTPRPTQPRTNKPTQFSTRPPTPKPNRIPRGTERPTSAPTEWRFDFARPPPPPRTKPPTSKPSDRPTATPTKMTSYPTSKPTFAFGFIRSSATRGVQGRQIFSIAMLWLIVGAAI